MGYNYHQFDMSFLENADKSLGLRGPNLETIPYGSKRLGR
jgi:hypothetical protein